MATVVDAVEKLLLSSHFKLFVPFFAHTQKGKSNGICIYVVISLTGTSPFESNWLELPGETCSVSLSFSLAIRKFT